MKIADLKAHPFDQFHHWYHQAKANQEDDLDAMALATASEGGKPSVRYLLYKGMDDKGFLLYTNYTSRKWQELEKNPRAALAFYWPKSYKQIRIEGHVERLTREESNQYFQSRARESQLGAWASRQSSVVDNRDVLDAAYERMEQKFADQEIPCPEFWGGFRIVPEVFEFWQGQAHRLHDRFRYEHKADEWKILRLAP